MNAPKPDQKPQSTDTASPHHRYSRWVGRLRWVLPICAGLLLAIVVIWPRFAQEESRFQLSFSDLTPQAVETLSMVNARYYGVDSRNNPFTVTADRAVEQENETGVIRLDKPKADFVTQGGSQVYLEAEVGYYSPNQQSLILEGGVNLFQDQGYELHTEKVTVDLLTATAESDTAVTGFGPQGAIDGQGFRVLDDGKHFEIKGRSSFKFKGNSK